jgi:hypothetical protein
MVEGEEADLDSADGDDDLFRVPFVFGSCGGRWKDI